MLEEDAYWRLTAFLLRENDFISGQEELGPDNAAQLRLRGAAPKLDFQTLSDDLAQPLAAPTPAAEVPPVPDEDQGLPIWILICAFGGILLLASMSWPMIVARLRRGAARDRQNSEY
jgi:hypothetical protein